MRSCFTLLQIGILRCHFDSQETFCIHNQQNGENQIWNFVPDVWWFYKCTCCKSFQKHHKTKILHWILGEMNCFVGMWVWEVCYIWKATNIDKNILDIKNRWHMKYFGWSVSSFQLFIKTSPRQATLEMKGHQNCCYKACGY